MKIEYSLVAYLFNGVCAPVCCCVKNRLTLHIVSSICIPLYVFCFEI